IARKLTKSDLAGFLAPLFWLSNIALDLPMSWTSSYNEIQCACFLLLTFYLFLRYTETGNSKFYWAQWITFVLGFGALEMNVVYPALAGLYALLFARRYFRSTLPMFAVSAVFAVLHRLAGSEGADNFYYDMSFRPGALLATLNNYRQILFGIPAFGEWERWPAGLVEALTTLLTVALLGFTLWTAAKRQFLPVFFLGWFLIVLAPLLPLHNHITKYYLAIPSIGIAMLAGYAVAIAWRRGLARAALATALSLLYLIPSAVMVHREMNAYFHRADRARALIQSVAYAKRIHPGRMILLKGVDNEVFWAGVYDSPFRIFGWTDVFLVPESRSLVNENPNLDSVDAFFLPELAIVRAVNEGSALVYQLEDRKLRNITRSYGLWLNKQPPPPLARSIDLAVPFFKDQVGAGWYDQENGFRWSGRHAAVYLSGLTAPNQRLYLHGFVAPEQIKAGPIHLAVSIDGRPQPQKTIEGSNLDFRFDYSLPAELVGRQKIEIAFNVDRTVQAAGRELGLAFG